MSAYKLLPAVSEYDFADKARALRDHVAYLLTRTNQMFIYEGLPASVPPYMFELYLQTNGSLCFYKAEEGYYIFTGSFGGPPDAYYRPTLFIISNPGLNLYKTLKIGEECCVVQSDSLHYGLLPLFARYASAMIENELTLHITSINSRILSLISAGDDRTFNSAKKYLDDVERGRLGVISENYFIEGIHAQPYGTNRQGLYTELIEYEQYLKASLYNELGLQAVYNLKREYVSSGEIETTSNAMTPLVENMLESRKRGVDCINHFYNLNIRVRLGHFWNRSDDLKSNSEDPNNV